MIYARVFSALVCCLVILCSGPGYTEEGEKETFDQWRKGFIEQAVGRGFEAAFVHSVFDDLTPDSDVIDRDSFQPEFTLSVQKYLTGVLSKARLSQGRAALRDNADIMRAISAHYQIPAQTLAAVWGLESAYGKIQGRFDVVRALATLAHDGRRRDWAQSQLFALLEIIKNKEAARGQLIGAWAGAMGQTQFLPSVYRRYAVDWDGDGVKDIWGSSADALASTANFLSLKGWRAGAPWGVEVQLRDEFAFELADDTVLSIGSWAVRGAVRADHRIWSMSEQGRPARLILPAGSTGPAFLVSTNFNVFKRYNNSTSYALGVGLLSDALGGGGGVITPWPKEQKPLTRAQKEDLQKRLEIAGYDPGRVDGMIGPNTRRALRAFQLAHNLVPDGFASATMLVAVRKETGSADGADTPVEKGE